MSRNKRRRFIDIKVLRGEPMDGSGRVCIHLFVQDACGPFTEPHALHPVFKDGQQVKQTCEARPTRGRLACDPMRVVQSTPKNGVVTVTPRTDDPRAVSCEKCKKTKDYLTAMEKITSAEAAR